MEFYDELRQVLQAVTIISPAAFTLAGTQYDVYPGVITSHPLYASHPLPPDPLVRDLQSALYVKCYAHRLDELPKNGGPRAVAPPELGFVQILSGSNQTQTRWDPGWSVYAVAPQGHVFIHKGERQRTAVPGEFATAGPPGVPPVVGSVVSLLVQREATGAQPGMYFAYSDVPTDQWDEFTLLRFYFHSTDAAAPDLLRYLTTQLNTYLVPFRMKAPVEPSHYPRTDAVVLYLAKRYFQITARLIGAMPDTLTAKLGVSVPLFSKRLRDGVGFAEEPGTGESFGMNRCRFVAEGIVEAWRQGDQTIEGRLRAVSGRFALNRVKFDKPYLNPGSEDLFDVPADTVISV